MNLQSKVRANKSFEATPRASFFIIGIEDSAKMDFFKHTLGPPDRGGSELLIWVRDTPYTPKEAWLNRPFNRADYEKDETQHLYFRWLDDQFICGNLDCKSQEVVCIWYRYDGIDWGVDVTFGEFYCDQCGQYTFVEYRRDSS